MWIAKGKKGKGGGEGGKEVRGGGRRGGRGRDIEPEGRERKKAGSEKRFMLKEVWEMPVLTMLKAA